MPAPRSALIVRLSSIGDVIHTLPAYTAIKDAWPDTSLGWAVEPAAAPLVRRLCPSMKVHVLDTSAWRRRFWSPATWSAMRRASDELRDAGYEIAIDFQGLIKSAQVARRSGARVFGLADADLREGLAARWYDEQAPADSADKHIIERSLGLARTAGVPAAPEAPSRFPQLWNDEDLEHVDRELERRRWDAFIVAHGAANWPSKQWPLSRQAAAGRDLFRSTGLPVIWLWGPGEEETARRTAAAAGEENHPAFATTLPQLAALIHRARLFVGGDSAPLHLAGAGGTPIVAVFGPTSPQRLGPIDPADRVVTSPQPCSFCHRRRCPLGTNACLETLPHGDVVAAARERLATAVAKAG
jgi:lipopolysaccharide heptosyltransferase I